MTWFKKSKASASSGNVSKGVSVAKDAAAIRAAPITATLPTDVALKPGGESGSSPPINDNNNLQNTSENLTMHAILHGPVHESSASRNRSSSLMPTGDGHQQPAAKKAGPFSFLRKYTGGNRKKPKESLREQLLDSLTEFPFQSAFNNEAAHERYDPTTNNNKLAKAYTAQNKPRSDRDRDIQASRATFPPVISPFDRRKSRRDRIYKDGTSQHSHSPPPRAQAAPAVQKPTRPALRRYGNYPPTAPPSRHPSLDLRRVPHGTSLESYTAYRELPPTAQGSQRSSLDLRRFSHHRIFPVHVDIASNQQLVDSESSLSPSSQSAFSSLDPFGYQFYLESVETAILEHQSLSHESEITSGNSNQPLFDQQEEIGANFEVNSSPGQQHGPYGLYTTKEEVSQLDNKPQRELQDLAEKLHRRLLEEQNRMFEQRKRAALSGRAGRAGMLDVEHPSASNLKASYPPTKLSDSARSSAEMRRVGSKPSLQDLERQCGPSFSRSTASSSRRTSSILDRRLQAEREALENVSRGRTSGVPEFQAHRTLNRGIMRHLSPSHDETYIPPPAYVSPKSSRINLVEIAESVRALANNGYTPRGRASASLASDSLGNAATLTRRVSSSNVDGFTLSPRGKCSNITSAGASGRNSLDVPGGSLTFRRTKSLACVHPLSQVESVESRVPTPHPEICQQYRDVSMNVDHPEIPDIFEPPEEHREYGLYNTIAHPPNSAPRTDIRHLFPGYAEAGPSSSNQSATPSGRPRILSTRAERAAERASRAAELEESVRTIRKRASDASVTGSLLTSRRSDINIPSTAATSSSVIARSATPVPTPPPQESDDTIIVNVPALPNAELQELRRVTTDMPIEFWLGRFSGMLDRIATMNLNVSGTDFNYKGYVMQRLKNDVGSEAAMKSFNDFYYYMINKRTGDEWYEGYKDRDRDVVKKIVLNEVDE
ncbi:hypothetical protein BZA77DRAFT_291971 [Pyronema omphalodes]|nr:hypothetical protein BZA77DRAFT_291971 [Pyronema omphalodes]